MSTPKTLTLPDGTELIAWMNTGSCSPKEGVECYMWANSSECTCPGAPWGGHAGPGIWLEKQNYFELKLLGEIT